MSFILEWQRPLQMVSHKSYNINANEDFILFLTSEVITFFYKHFHSIMKSQSIASLLSGGTHTHTHTQRYIYIYMILDLESEVHSIWDLWKHGLQKCQGNDSPEVKWVGRSFQSGKKYSISLWMLPLPVSTSLEKLVGGGLMSPPLRFSYLQFVTFTWWLKSDHVNRNES